ncbi:MAG: tRNA (uridine(34)/cytosine(34)/5-carboxymethylaminomethyluridine(34)-2'-O)-methyltransferase TrmL [Candidatus Cloacimonetes bacterium HGW-Cloacimonetes-1]|jgi:tRNA (cytidine/uridine-2'-O-)-methyltransferase|nr:MAG: tRNA (uridine(34)/cytosine(34)/5-carboxymethylaminomethyluridine(34)-2'-O)-methyltransferase TrmL [Candidatus Cloacimonetes bacterium HGW-Cloacimonetes-1]
MIEIQQFQFHIVLYQPEIPANTGNIGRLCVGTNSVLHLVKPFRFFIDDKSLKRAGLDYWHLLDVRIHETLEDALKQVDPQRVFYCTTKTKNEYTKINYQSGDCFVFGPESRGLPETMLQDHSEQTITIPMSNNIRSINLSNSVAIILYEAVRQLNH